MPEDSNSYEIVLLVKSEVFVYKIPPLSGNKGYKASDWDLGSPGWIGRLRLISMNNKLEIRLEDKTSGDLFAKAPISQLNSVDFEPVMDSSRYFVIRLQNDNGQTAFVGIGFADRSDSFDLNVAVQDHFKTITKCESQDAEENSSRLDLSFKEGQTITVNIGKKTVNNQISKSQSTNEPVPLLPPPPSGNRIRNLRDTETMGGVTITAVTRLKKDYQKLLKDPVPYAIAVPLPSNILEWHYVVTGAPDTPYEGGYYHGKLIFPQDFPFRPPSIYIITPSGRFQVNTRLCLSISDFHPDTWNPSWSVSTIIMGLISFMNENSPTLGSLTTSEAEKRILAKRSREFNLRNPQFCELFTELADQIRKELDEEKASLGDNSSIAATQTERQETSSSLATNLMMVTGVVLLFFAVRYVILNAAV